MSVTPSATLVVPRSPASQTAEAPAASFFTKEKITRLALWILSTLALLGAIVVGANVIAGTIAAWHAFTSLCLYLLYKELWAQADQTFDLNDPHERQLASAHLRGCSFPCMLQLYPPDTILQYGLVPLDVLRRDCYHELRYTMRYRDSIPQTLIENANQLLHHRIVTLEIHRMIVENDIAALNRLPGNSVQMDEIFRAYDNL